MAVLTVTLTVVYLSFRAGVPPMVRHTPTRTNAECVRMAQKIKAKVKAGKVRIYCNGRKI